MLDQIHFKLCNTSAQNSLSKAVSRSWSSEILQEDLTLVLSQLKEIWKPAKKQ